MVKRRCSALCIGLDPFSWVWLLVLEMGCLCILQVVCHKNLLVFAVKILSLSSVLCVVFIGQEGDKESAKGGTETALVEDGGDKAGCVQLLRTTSDNFFDDFWTFKTFKIKKTKNK